MFRTISVATVGVLVTCGVAAAQPAPRIELWGGVTVAAPKVDTTITTSYVPYIDQYSAPLAGSSAGQTLALKSSTTAGLEGGVNLFFTRHVGVQVLIDSDRPDLSGDAGDYNVLLNYTARQPSDYVERQYSYSHTYTACTMPEAHGCVRPTLGTLKQVTFGVDLVGRWPIGRRINAEVSGGLSYFDVRGDADGLRYTLFRMGGHSTLFSQEYQLGYSIEPAHAVGFNLGGTLDLELAPWLAVTADARYFGGPTISAPVTVVSVLNADEIVFLQDAATVQEAVHPPDVEIDPGRARVMLGLKVRF